MKPSMDLADHVRELCSTHVHREHFTTREHGTWFGQDHVTQVPPLIDQLLHAAPAPSGDLSGSSYGSRPTAHIEALDTLIRIDLEAAAWVKDLGEDDPGDTKACIRKLHGLQASAHQVTRRAIERDVKAWWTQARICSGWDSPPWRPNNTCPLCGIRGGLRVNLTDQTGFCVECRTTWATGQIGLLADHIRGENCDGFEPEITAASAG